MRHITLFLAILCMGALVACGTQEPAPTDVITSPLSTPASAASPLPTPAEAVPADGSPAPTPDLPQEMLVPFRLEKPLRAGDTQIRGSGPPGVPIIIANITLMGEQIVFGEIGPDGRFDFELSNPLEENYRIGLALGDMTGKSWTEETFRHPMFHGDEAQTVPQAGFYYDSSQVQP